jgi:hypothetical protein
MNVKCENLCLYVTEGRRISETFQSSPELVGALHKQLYCYVLPGKPAY